MPVQQSTYTTNIATAKAGHIGDMRSSDLSSRTVEPVGGLAFGVAVAQGANPQGVIAYAGSNFYGVTTRDRSVYSGESYNQYESARILTKGPIWVAVGLAVSAGQQVYVTPAGAFTNVSTSNFAIPNARFETTTAGAGLALIFIK